jgi:peptide chain release factor 3
MHDHGGSMKRDAAAAEALDGEARFARRVEGDAERIQDVAGGGYGRTLVRDSKGRPLILFDSEWTMRSTIKREKELHFHDIAP